MALPGQFIAPGRRDVARRSGERFTLLASPNADGPESDRVSKALDGWNTVFPFSPRRSPEQVGRPRFSSERHTIPSHRSSPPEPERTGGEQRNSDDIAEHRLVLVPTYGGSGRILGNQHVAQFRTRQAGEVRRALPYRKQKVGHLRYLPQVSPAEVVVPAERHHAPFAEIAVEFELPQRELREPLHQCMFLLG
jgi:hypothetical protein